MKITIYELLGLVKDGKAPKRFKYDGYVWTYNYESSAYWNKKGIEFEDYMDDGLMNYLNEKVEILEEQKKIPEKINNWTSNVGRVDDSNIEEYVHKLFEQQTILYFKTNSIIDYLKSKGDD